MAIRKLLSAQIGLFHFENCINLTNSEKAIEDQYHLLNEEIEYGKLKALNSDFYDSSSDNSLFYLFHDAFGYANSHKEAYLDIKNVMFEMVKLLERIVLHFNNIVISIQTALFNYISAYKCLMQDSDYEQAAYAILGSINDYQMETIFLPLKQIAEQPLSVKATIEKIVLKYIPLQEHFETGYIKNLQKPICLLRNSLLELFNTTTYVTSAYENMKEAMKGRMMNTVKQAHLKSWENQETKKSFLKYYSKLLALCLTCKDVKNVFEDLLINFRSLIHEI